MNLFSINETNTLKNHKEKVGDIMTSLKPINRRVGSLFAVAALVLATVTPGLVPAFASAAQLSERSVELSSSSKGAEGVEYTVTFTTANEAGAVVLDFCGDTPLIGANCAAPGGFSVATATPAPGSDFTKSTGDAADANTAVLVGDIDGETTVVLRGVKNPSEAGPLYVRIVTYADVDAETDAEDAANSYTSAGVPGEGSVDQGSAAASITDSVGVSAAVLESMTFCVAGELVSGENCRMANDDEPSAPVVKLGQGTGDIRALDAQHVSEGSIFSQISTNAASGAIVSLKSSTLCGGLKRPGVEVTTCDIAAAGADGIEQGDAKFGVAVKSAADPNSGANSTGAYQIFGTTGGTAYYDASVFKLNYDSQHSTGITSPYGDKLLDTAGAPVNNKNVEITFAASAANNTPAGLYSTDLSLIATGKF